MLPENRAKVVELLEVLKPRILGQERPAWQCCCGAIKCGAAKAVEVRVADDSYPGFEMDPLMWSVSMQNLETGEHEYSVGLSDFIKMDELLRIFAERFGDCDEALQRSMADTRYRLEVTGSDRAIAGLPPAVAIQDTPRFTRFWVEWGTAQKLAWYLGEEFYARVRDLVIEPGSKPYDEVVAILRKLNPVVYVKGPEPELSFESRWLTNLPEVLLSVQQGEYDNVVVSCGARTYSSDGRFVTDSTITFWKVE